MSKTRNHTENRRERGMATAELALLLPLLTLLFLLLVEGANAMRVYSVIQEASREGARMVLRDGDISQVPALIEALAQRLPDTDLATSITTATGGNAVTVEVTYQYQSFYGYNPALEALGETPYVFRAKTTMPLP